MDTTEAVLLDDTSPNATPVNPAIDPVVNFELKISSLKAKSLMLEGFARQRPHVVKKYAGDMLRDTVTLEAMLSNLIPATDVRHDEYSSKINNCRELATIYFEAATNLDIDLPVTAAPQAVAAAPALDEPFKLQKCTVPTFDGDVRHFKQWWEYFENSVHVNPSLTDRHKMIYLISSTKRTAREFLRGYEATGDNYEKALREFRARFGDSTKLAQSYFADFASLPDLGGVTGEHVTVDQDRANLDKIKTLILGLRSTGNYDTELAQGWVIQKISHARVREAFMRLSLQYPTLNFELDELLQAIETSVYIDEVIALRSIPSERADESTKVTTMAHTKTVKRAKHSCMFCRGQHASTDCQRYPTYNERKQRLQTLRRCVICLSEAHEARACTNRDRRCRNCGKAGHLSPLCMNAIRKVKPTVAGPSNARASAPKRKQKKETPPQVDAQPSGTFLETFVCTILVNGRSTLTRGVLDGGSDTSYVHTDVLKRLNIRPPREFTVSVQAYGSSDLVQTTTGRVNVTLRGANGTQKTCSLLSSNCIVGNSSLAPPHKEVSFLLPYDLEYADPDLFNPIRRPIELLLGNDLKNQFVRLNRDKKLCDGLIIKPTMFGWIPSGKATTPYPPNITLSTTVSRLDDQVQTKGVSLNCPEVKQLWDLEVLGIRTSELDTTNDVVIEQFRKTARFENGRYVVKWPRRVNNLNLPTHYRMCVARLKSLLNSSDAELLARYEEVLSQQELRGIIEKAPRASRHDVHYLPHKPVVRNDKLRIVYDASAKLKSGRSLNDLLHAGPSLTTNLLQLLLNFRVHEIALTSDIEKAFLHVGLDEADRDLVRFLWVEDYTHPVDQINVIAYRFTRTPFGVVSSPFLLNMVLQELLADNDSPTFQLVRQKFYVDNFVISVPDLNQAVSLFESLTERLASADFNLRNWASNSDVFIDALPPEKRMDEEDEISILGLGWKRKDDSMSIRFKEEENSSHVTLRTALGALASVYDPLGLCAPCILDFKLFIQQCWKIKAGWDDPLPTGMDTQFRKLLAEREEIRTVSFPRYLWETSSMIGSYELHGFCDASQLSYGCAVYLVHKTPHKTEARIIFAKGRIAPIQPRTIPQLELLGVTTGQRAITTVRNSIDLQIARTILWTDATTVLQWLSSPTIQSQFVQNRLQEIRNAYNVCIRYTPSKDNPADILSRGLRAGKLRNNPLWWTGPYWLTQERLWPSGPVNVHDFSTSTVRTVTLCSKHTKVQTLLLTDEFEKRHSCWKTYVKRILRLPFLAAWYEKSNLTSAESFHRAELILIRLVQQKYFAVELAHLKEGNKIHSDLQLFLHTDGIIRCKGRIETAPIEWDMANPIYLPRESPLVRTLILYIHRITGHSGTDITLSEFRGKFWTSKGRSLVNSVIHRCNLCRRWKGGPYRLPSMPPLPEVRMTPVAPFVNIGVDCFGPLRVRVAASDTTTHKMYGVIYTCLVTRAIHLELVFDMSGDQFLQSLIRFSSRRGKPQMVISDNGRNFAFIQPLLGRKVEIRDPRLDEYVIENKINWYFIPAYCPWMGGVYERMIGLVKNTMLRVLGSRVVTYSTLLTVFCQVENIVNSRPLTHISPNEISQPLTPNTFLRPANSAYPAEIEVNPRCIDSSASKLLPGYKAVRRITEFFRSQFYSRYLRLLRDNYSRTHPAPKGSVQYAPRVGDMVIVKGSVASRAQWPLGVIESLDGRAAQAQVRIIDWAATEKLPPGQNQLYRTKMVQKAVNTLYPLEIPYEEPSATMDM